MPRAPRTPAHQARCALLRGHLAQTFARPHDALGVALPEEEWQAHLEGRAARFFVTNGLRARRAVKKRHPMRERGA